MSAFTEIKKYIQTFEKYGCKEYETGQKNMVMHLSLLLKHIIFASLLR